jgi:putative membrane-bound dehydrogenase-like protein
MKEMTMKYAAVALLLSAAGLWLMVPAGSAGGGTIPQATDAPRPLTPEEGRTRFRLPDGFRIELVAAEPLLREPTGLCFDARGRIFVCELHGYNLDGYYDILELNKTGVLDTAVRRIPASQEAERRAAKETYGTVRMLETDGGGRVVRSTVFADRLPPCYGVVPARDGVIVLCAPDVVYLADRDGDGKAEVRETLFTGFGVGEIWTRISNPRWGPDNWIYAAAGMASGGTIRGPHLKGEVKLGSTCFRFKPDGSRIEPVSGGTSGFGLALDDWGDRFLCTNQQHALYVAPLPYEALARNPYTAAVNPVVNVCTYGHPARVFPTSQPDPWRRKRGRQAEWVKFYGASETSAGLFTSACAPALYRADQFPEAYRGNHFSCEPAQNLVHRCLLEPQGAGFEARRADEGREFLTSTDRWFRPVNLTVGPEGALYVVDMYREIIEDYSAIPRYLQQQYVESLRNGHDRGRIWRVVYGDKTPATDANLAAGGPDRLLAELASPSAWRRLTAQRLLVERGERKAVPALEELCRSGRTPQARLHALYTLEGLGALTPESVAKALGDAHYGVRLHALRLAGRWLDLEPALLAKVLARAEDPDPKVRLQLALTLGESRSPDVLPVLAHLASAGGQDPWMRAAVLSAAPERSAALARVVANRGGERGRSFLRPLTAVTGTRHDEGETAALLEWLVGLKGDAVRAEVLAGLAEGLGRDAAKKPLSAAGQKALERLLEGTSGPLQKEVLRVAGLVRLGESPALNRLRKTAAAAALDEARPVAERVASLASLQGAPPPELAPLRGLLAARQPLDLQLAAVGILAAADGAEAMNALFADWPTYSPRVQTAILDAVCARQDRLPLVLDAIEKRVIDPASLPPLRQTQLLENRDPGLRSRAKTLLARRVSSDDRKRVLAKYQAALALPRDSKRGREVFEKQCSKCHQLNGRGTAVGPDLAAVQDRPDDSILVDVLDPSSSIVPGYRAYTVTTRGGRLYSGVLAAETATSVTLRREQGAEDTILRKDIDEMAASAKSLMPEGLEKEVSVQDLADLIGYLREALRPGARALPLFDGDPAFPRALGEGAGKAVVTPDEPFAGRPSLRVSPPQRFAAHIPGWDYKIVERPAGPGEYRYLRFAWKSPGGTGVMLELADNGAWPGAGEARGRYYSGANSTGWKAVRVAKAVPRDWVVVTRDLWKECGPLRLTGLAPTAMGGDAFFARIELLPSLEPEGPGQTGRK